MGWSLATKRDKAKSSKESCPNLLCLAAYMATYPSLPPFPTLHPTNFGPKSFIDFSCNFRN
jgi:hypothetical protein